MKTQILRKLQIVTTLTLLGTIPLFAQDESIEEDEDIQVLSEFEVTAESVRGWVASSGTVATAAASKLIDIPQQVTIITREFLDDNGSVSELDVIQKATPGVIIRNNANLDVDIRGFRSLESGIDGVVSRVVYNYPSILFERLEVVKGPASLLYGSFATAGGFINRVSKDPEHKFGGFIQGTIGTSDLYEVGVDVTGPIEAFDGNVQYRIIADIVDRDNVAGFGDTYDKHHAISFEFAFDLGKTDRLIIGYWHNDRDVTGGDRGIIDPSTAEDDSGATRANPVHTGVPLRGFVAGQAFSEFNDFPAILQTQADVLDVNYTSNPFPGFSFRTHFVWEHRQQAGNLFHGSGNNLADVYNAAFSGNDDDQEILNALIDGTWTYRHSENFENRLTMGAEVSYINGTFTRAVGGSAIVGGLVPITVDNLQAYLDQPLPEIKWSDTGESDELIGGFYAQDRLSFWQNKLQFNVGIRYNWIGAARLFIPTPTGVKGDFRTDPVTGEQIPNFDFDEYQRHFAKASYVSTPYGFVVKPIEQLSFFYGFTDAFRSNGSNTLTFDGKRPGPSISEGTEYGVKFDFLKGVSGTISFFDIDVNNRITGDPDNVGYKIILDPINNQGWEIFLSYALKDFTIMGGYYHGDIKDKNTGFQVDRTANDTYNLAARYQASKGSLAGLYLGGNHSWVSEMPQRGGTRITPSYAVTDVFLGYRWGDWKFQVNGKNIFDENYNQLYVRPSLTLVAPGESWQFSVTRYFGSRSVK